MAGLERDAFTRVCPGGVRAVDGVSLRARFLEPETEEAPAEEERS